jgi:hypothetical protein
VGETSHQIEQGLREERASLGRNLRELEDRARQAVDWREHYRAHPGVGMGVAFGAALAVGLLAIPAADSWDSADVDTRAASRPPMSRGAGRDTSRLVSLGRSFERSPILAKVQGHATDTLERVAETLVALATAKVIGYLAGALPGFGDEFERRRPTAG